ncbi:MAG: hypothetical protein CM1200mP38_7570 [Dehalococcoidia bacterium]|nr:MAG: hypothetical protein CM1200mP38_7570 [Dehalococcoidia bacterium]
MPIISRLQKVELLLENVVLLREGKSTQGLADRDNK